MRTSRDVRVEGSSCTVFVRATQACVDAATDTREAVRRFEPKESPTRRRTPLFGGPDLVRSALQQDVEASQHRVFVATQAKGFCS